MTAQKNTKNPHARKGRAGFLPNNPGTPKINAPPGESYYVLTRAKVLSRLWRRTSNPDNCTLAFVAACKLLLEELPRTNAGLESHFSARPIVRAFAEPTPPNLEKLGDNAEKLAAEAKVAMDFDVSVANALAPDSERDVADEINAAINNDDDDIGDHLQ